MNSPPLHASAGATLRLRGTSAWRRLRSFRKTATAGRTWANASWGPGTGASPSRFEPRRGLLFFPQMAALLLDGKLVRDQILSELSPRVEHMTHHGVRPGLAVVLVGNDPASEIYVRNKVKA